MRLSERATFRRRFYIADGTELTPWRNFDHDSIDRSFDHSIDEHRREDLAKLGRFAIEKPDWFERAERSARRFVRDLGITAAKGTPIRLIDPKTKEDFIDIFDSDNFIAHNAHGIGIVFPMYYARNYYEHGGEIGIAQTLVHELSHSAEFDNPDIAMIYERDDNGKRKFIGYHSRQGLVQSRLDEEFGSFLQEGIGDMLGGLYVRRQADPTAKLSSIQGYPSPERPSFYLDGLTPKMNGTDYGAGYNAHTLDMISWKAWKMGQTATQDTLLEAMLSTLSDDAGVRLAALRTVPRIVNAVDPGLYSRLRRVRRDFDEWRSVMEAIHERVTSN